MRNIYSGIPYHVDRVVEEQKPVVVVVETPAVEIEDVVFTETPSDLFKIEEPVVEPAIEIIPQVEVKEEISDVVVAVEEPVTVVEEPIAVVEPVVETPVETVVEPDPAPIVDEKVEVVEEVIPTPSVETVVEPVAVVEKVEEAPAPVVVEEIPTTKKKKK